MSMEELEKTEYRTARRMFWEKAAMAQFVCTSAAHAAFRADEMAEEWAKRFPPPVPGAGPAYLEASTESPL